MTDKEYRILEATLSADIVETESQVNLFEISSYSICPGGYAY